MKSNPSIKEQVTLADIASPNPSPAARAVVDRAMKKAAEQQNKTRREAEAIRESQREKLK